MSDYHQITEIPLPDKAAQLTEFVAWQDWSGPDVIRLLHEGFVDSIFWGIRNTEQFEKAQRMARGRVLCVTGLYHGR